MLTKMGGIWIVEEKRHNWNFFPVSCIIKPMSTKLEKFLYEWPKPYIRDQDLYLLFELSSSRRHDAIKYAMAHETLLQIRRGLYLIRGANVGRPQYDPFELAQVIYGPSYISLESALSHHGWIPEGVYVTTSVTSRREKLFDTPIGHFRYARTPMGSFYSHVELMGSSSSTFLMAHPWKAIADYLYVYKKNWLSISNLKDDLRIEENKIEEYDINVLLDLTRSYGNEKVRKKLTLFLKEIGNGN
jgi:hypothetical protein